MQEEQNMEAQDKSPEKKEENGKVGAEELKIRKLQLIFTILNTVFSGLIFVVIAVTALLIFNRVDKVYKSAMVSLENLEKLTTELDEADVPGTVRHIDKLTVQATEDLSRSMEKLDSVDLETLNGAIKNLYDTIEPMAEFFRKTRNIL